MSEKQQEKDIHDSERDIVRFWEFGEAARRRTDLDRRYVSGESIKRTPPIFVRGCTPNSAGGRSMMLEPYRLLLGWFAIREEL